MKFEGKTHSVHEWGALKKTRQISMYVTEPIMLINIFHRDTFYDGEKKIDGIRALLFGRSHVDDEKERKTVYAVENVPNSYHPHGIRGIESGPGRSESKLNFAIY